jgi:hypothetical protein
LVALVFVARRGHRPIRLPADGGTATAEALERLGRLPAVHAVARVGHQVVVQGDRARRIPPDPVDQAATVC